MNQLQKEALGTIFGLIFMGAMFLLGVLNIRPDVYPWAAIALYIGFLGTSIGMIYVGYKKRKEDFGNALLFYSGIIMGIILSILWILNSIGIIT